MRRRLLGARGLKTISCRDPPFSFLPCSDAFSSVRQREVSSVAGILEQAKLDKLDILLVFKTDSVCVLYV